MAVRGPIDDFSDEDANLWFAVTERVTPLPRHFSKQVSGTIGDSKGRKARPVIAPEDEKQHKFVATFGRMKPPGAPSRSISKKLTPHKLDSKEQRAFQTGRIRVEARIDLHGLYQAQAHAALVAFIKRARADGHLRVLVITGKGTAGIPDAERGVLRRCVPQWLMGANLRDAIVSFGEASHRHGGSGALYVRLRRS